MDSRLEDNKTTTEKEIKEKELVIYALYRDRRMLPYQGRDPYVTALQIRNPRDER